MSQTGDSFARLGAPVGASISADIAAVKSDTSTILIDVNSGAGAIYTRIGAPVGASISADIAAVKTSVGSPQQVGTKYAVTLLSTDVSGNLPSDLQTIKTQTVTCAAGVTINPFVGNATHALIVDASGFVTFSNTSIGTVTTLTNLPSIPVNWLTAAGIAANALDGKGDWLLASSYTAPDNTDITNIYNIVNSGTFGNSAINTHIATLQTTANSILVDVTSPSDTSGITTLLSRLSSGRALLLDNLDATISSRSTYAGRAVASVTAGVTVTTNNDKTGYILGSAGLDSISVAPPGGIAVNFTQMMIQLWRRFFKQVVKNQTNLTIKTYADDGTTVITTHPYQDDGAGNQTMFEAQ